MQCPAISKRKDVGASYSSFARNLEEFQKIGSVPANVNVEELNEGQGIEHTLKERKASWHKTCRNAFSNEKLERAKKRKHESEKLEENNDLLATGSSASLSRPDGPAFQATRRTTTASFVNQMTAQKIFIVLAPLSLTEK